MMILAIDWFGDEYTKYADATFYFYLAVIGTALFVIRLLLMLIGGVDGGDVDFDIDTDGGLEAHGDDFTIFSLLSIVAFMMGVGWMGLACRIEFGWGAFISAVVATMFGVALMFLASFSMYKMKKFEEHGKYNVKNCIGQIGQVYLKIPARGAGQGQVQVNVDGRQKVLGAVSSGDSIDSFAAVKITGIHEGEILVVEKL